MYKELIVNRLKSKYLNSWSWFGSLEYLLVRNRKALLPLNGQEMRKIVFTSLINKLAIEVIVETGVYRGASTEWFAGFPDVQVYAVESSPRFYAFSMHRLGRLHNVSVWKGDSRNFL
jgi:predicted RNA methylase